jgi:hypothetical protein
MTDHELDDALRALTEVDADPALAGRVLARLERPAATTELLPWLAAAAVLVAVVGVSWYGGRSMTLPRTSDPPLVLSAPLPVPDVPAAADATAMASSKSLTRNAFKRVEAADVPWPERLPALRRAPLIEIEPIMHTPIHQHELAVAPLSIVQLEIASLDR